MNNDDDLNIYIYSINAMPLKSMALNKIWLKI